MKKQRLYIEVTDTFGKELNYSWVRRYIVDAPIGASEKAIITFAKRNCAPYGRHYRNDSGGDTIDLRFPTANVATLIQYVDNDYNATELRAQVLEW